MEIIIGTALTFVYAHLEYFVAGVSILGGGIYFKCKHVVHHNNDLTSLIVKQKRYSESVNKRSKLN